jgi:hypothetical protein
VFTGMNNDGDFYIGNKRIASATGQEETYDAPIPTVTGEDNISQFNIINPFEINVIKSIKVEGGPTKESVSKFDGPVIFNNKITSTSDKGIETNTLLLQGTSEVSRRISIANTIPTIIANSGDINFNSTPSDSSDIGWVYTSNNAWRKFGPIQNSSGRYVGIWSGTFFGDGSGLTGLESTWVVQPNVGIYTGSNVGIGTTARANVKLSIDGRTNINGILNVTEIIEKATIVTTAWPSLDTFGNALDVNIYLGDNNVYYYTSPVSKNWTVNFSGYSTGTTLNQLLNVGDSITIAFLATVGTTSFYNNAIKIDGTSITPRWYGGVAPTFGNISSIDSYTYVIIKTGNASFTVLASQSYYA